MNKYGMKFSTIRFWQERAYLLNFHNGIIYRGAFSLQDLSEVNPRAIGHDAIAAARVHTPEAMRRLLESGR